MRTTRLGLLFPGQYFDAESGLHYNYFRDYDPKTGRYVEPDPVGLLAGPNIYGYVGGNPVRYSDPKGLLLPLAGAVPWLVGGSITGETGAFILSGLFAIGTGVGSGATYDPDVIVLPGDMPFAWDSPDDRSPPVPIPLNPPEACKDQKDDKPCDPPEGTQCYAGPDYGRPHGGMSPHYHIYEMQKKRSDGTCFWRYLGGRVGAGVVGIPSAAMKPCSSYPNFKGRGSK